MKVKGIKSEDFVNYYKPSIFIICPFCDFKCDRENGYSLCQNSSLAHEPNISISPMAIVNMYINNPITKAIVFGGLEPFDSWNELFDIIYHLRQKTNDDIIIYTGYNKNEILDKLEQLSQYKNIIVKFGRFRPDEEPHYDEVLGVKLASDNQYAERIS